MVLFIGYNTDFTFTYERYEMIYRAIPEFHLNLGLANHRKNSCMNEHDDKKVKKTKKERRKGEQHARRISAEL